MLIPSPNIFAATVIADLVILDVDDDSYQVMHGAVVGPGKGIAFAGLDAEIDPDAAQALLDAGCCSDDAGEVYRPPIEHPPVGGEHLGALVPATVPDVLTFVAAMALASWRARRTRTCRSFARARSPGRKRLRPGDLQEALARLRAARLLVPSPRRCLPASLVSAAFLHLKGIDSEIVFAVRGHPFGAHCWLERDGIVLDDEVDRVAAFTPIAVGRP